MNQIDKQIDEAKNHVEFLWLHRRYKNKFPTVFDYMEALTLPPDEVIKAYNELVTEGKIKGKEVVWSPCRKFIELIGKENKSEPD